MPVVVSRKRLHLEQGPGTPRRAPALGVDGGSDALAHAYSRADQHHAPAYHLTGDVAPAGSQAKSRAPYQVYEQAIAVLVIRGCSK